MSILSTPLVGKKVSIRLPREADLDAMFRLDNESAQISDKAEWFANAKRLVEFASRENLARTTVQTIKSIEPLIINLKNTDVFVGRAALKRHPGNEWQIEIWVASAYRQQHLAREVYLLLGRMLFDQFDASAVIIEFHPEHPASMRLAGFFYHSDVGALVNHEATCSRLAYRLQRDEYVRVVKDFETRLGLGT